jgi:hypothetical protein
LFYAVGDDLGGDFFAAAGIDVLTGDVLVGDVLTGDVLTAVGYDLGD